jgi:plastocyanin
MKLRMLIFTFLLASFGTLAFSACGDDDDGTITESPAESPTSQPTESASSSPVEETFTPAPSAAASQLVVIQDFSFNPRQFSVPADEVVAIEVENADRSSHTFTVYTDAEYENAQGIALPLTSDTTKTGYGTFAAGTYYFRCEVHPQNMQGTFTAE